MFRTYTKCKVVDPRRRGLSIYNKSQVQYNYEITKAKCAGLIDIENDPSMLYLTNKLDEEIDKSLVLTEDQVSCYRRDYGVNYILTEKNYFVQNCKKIFTNDFYAVWMVE